jgi:hypothetical protein
MALIKKNYQIKPRLFYQTLILKIFLLLLLISYATRINNFNLQ